MTTNGLGRRAPTDWKHVEKYPLRELQIIQVGERRPALPSYHAAYDQGREGACVGFSLSWMMSILNRRRYAPRWLYNQAQLIDEWDETPPEEGTSVRAGCDILRTKGHRRVYDGRTLGARLSEGIVRNEWATNVDQIRLALAHDIPVVLGINWYDDFEPRKHPSNSTDWWIGETDRHWGRVVGGHAICVTAVSDRRQALALTNTWGPRIAGGWPARVWIPYESVQRLLDEYGEACLVVDR